MPEQTQTEEKIEELSLEDTIILTKKVRRWVETGQPINDNHYWGKWVGTFKDFLIIVEETDTRGDCFNPDIVIYKNGVVITNFYRSDIRDNPKIKKELYDTIMSRVLKDPFGSEHVKEGNMYVREARTICKNG
ncbi:hypothetical protein KY342_07085 [Candidatus Woesearchaeota archaeon]|nr:hypothetical protein [Candidatus Woesearchaeota archaeon]